MVPLPYYMLPPKQAIMDHFRNLRDAITIPIILYNNPWVCGVELHSRDIAQLVDEGVVNAVKASHGDPFRVQELKYLCGDRVQALYGHEYAPLEAFLTGADGWLTGNLNIFPRQAKDLWQAAGIEKNITKAKRIWSQMMPYIYYSLYEKSDAGPHFITIYKEALNILGHNVGKPRLPLQTMTSSQRNRLQEVLEPLMQTHPTMETINA
jgi:4-hydroxy-tetrahydrodipicolinate synthase